MLVFFSFLFFLQPLFYHPIHLSSFFEVFGVKICNNFNAQLFQILIQAGSQPMIWKKLFHVLFLLAKRVAGSVCVISRGFTNSSKSISPGCVGRRFLGSLRSVAVCDFNFISMTFLPSETDSVLPADPDAVLIFPVPFQMLQTVSRRFPAFRHIPDAADLIRFPADCGGRLRAAFAGSTGGCSVKDVFSAGCFKRLYHGWHNNGKRLAGNKKGIRHNCPIP